MRDFFNTHAILHQLSQPPATDGHEIGIIAEEVGEVVPEVVSYEENGKDARGVDYSRLTALLIEATKEQQRELAKALRQIRDMAAEQLQSCRGKRALRLR